MCVFFDTSDRHIVSLALGISLIGIYIGSWYC